jgi:uncharacterized membrane protein YgcG
MASGPLSAATGFNDVVLGSNVGYTATPGWDYTTGLGTFDIAAISKALKPVASGLKAPATLGGNPCVTPGARIAEGVANSQTDHLPGHNVLAIDIAEPYSTAAGNDSFVFTMTVDSLANVPPATGYFIYYFLPDGSEHYLAYESTPAMGATSNFSYGTIATTETGSLLINYVPTQQGYTDVGSKLDTTNNQIIWVLKKSNLKGYVEGQSVLTRVYGEVDIEATPVASNAGQSTTQPVDDTPEGNYTPVGNAACATGVPVTSTGGSGGTSNSGGSSSTGSGSDASGGSTTAGSGGGITTATSTVKGRFGGGAMPLVALLAMALTIPVRRRRRASVR